MTCCEEYVPNRFVAEKIIGKGAYGEVWCGRRIADKKRVALKYVTGAFSTERSSLNTLREIVILSLLRGHPNIIKLYGSGMMEGNPGIVIAMNFASKSLKEVIFGDKISITKVRKFTYQLLNGLSYMHSINVMHRDVKPENILIMKNKCLKIADFGLARHLPVNEKEKDFSTCLSRCVGTPCYQAPEVLVASRKYDTSCDIWSVGVILGDMIHGRSFFQCSSRVGLINFISRLFPAPNNNEIDFDWNGMCQSYDSLDIYLGPVQEEEKDLLKKLLVINPKERLSAVQALGHPFLRKHKKILKHVLSGQDINNPYLNMHSICPDLCRSLLERHCNTEIIQSPFQNPKVKKSRKFWQRKKRQ